MVKEFLSAGTVSWLDHRTLRFLDKFQMQWTLLPKLKETGLGFIFHSKYLFVTSVDINYYCSTVLEGVLLVHHS